MKILQTTTMALSILFLLGALQAGQATVIKPIAPVTQQDHMILTRGGGHGGGHGHGGHGHFHGGHGHFHGGHGHFHGGHGHFHGGWGGGGFYYGPGWYTPYCVWGPYGYVCY